MKKSMKKIISLALVLTLLLGCALPVNAASAKSVSNNKKVMKNVKRINVYCLTKFAKSKSYKKLKLTTKTRYNTMIAGRFMIDHQYRYSSEAQVKQYCKEMFGKSGKMSSNCLRKDGRGYVYIGGEWGIDIPKTSIKKVQKISKNKFVVTSVAYLKSDDNGVISGKINVAVTLKKSNKSSTGYIVTGVKYKRI